MILWPVAFCLGVLAALPAGGSLGRLVSVRFRWSLLPWLAILSLGAVALLVQQHPDWFGEDPGRIRLTGALAVPGLLSVLFLLGNLLPLPRPRLRPGDEPLRWPHRLALVPVLLGLGGLLAVRLANRGALPYSPDLLATMDDPGMRLALSERILLLESLVDDTTRLRFLAATIPFPLRPAAPFASPAELVLLAGLFLSGLALSFPLSRPTGGPVPPPPEPRPS